MQTNKYRLVFQLLRLKQYVKNLFCFLPVFFAGKMTDGSAVLASFHVFLAFCLAASAIYILNDFLDREEDRAHPIKKNRPLANGDISYSIALGIAVCLALAACGLTYFLSGPDVLSVIMAYIAINIAYSFFAKKISIVDITCIAAGFVLRVVGGSLVVAQTTSPWLVLQTFLLCMVLGLGKRWDDIRLSKDGRLKGAARASLSGYSEQFVTVGISFFATISCVCYIIYTISQHTQEHYQSEYVYLTSFWVIMGMARYLQIMLVYYKSGSPTDIFLRDRFILLTIVGWCLHLSLLLYRPHLLG